jgi:hypothetical protein
MSAHKILARSERALEVRRLAMADEELTRLTRHAEDEHRRDDPAKFTRT